MKINVRSGIKTTPRELDCDLNAAPGPLGHPDSYLLCLRRINFRSYQDDFPEEDENLLDWEVRSATAAELGDHREEHHSNAVLARY